MAIFMGRINIARFRVLSQGFKHYGERLGRQNDISVAEHNKLSLGLFKAFIAGVRSPMAGLTVPIVKLQAEFFFVFPKYRRDMVSGAVVNDDNLVIIVGLIFYGLKARD